jgi:hypothetical protein
VPHPPGAWSSLSDQVLERRRSEGGVKNTKAKQPNSQDTRLRCSQFCHTMYDGAHPWATHLTHPTTGCSVCHRIDIDPRAIFAHCPSKLCRGVQVCIDCVRAYEAETPTALQLANEPLHELLPFIAVDTPATLALTPAECCAHIAAHFFDVPDDRALRLSLLGCLADNVRRFAPLIVHPDTKQRITHLLAQCFLPPLPPQPPFPHPLDPATVTPYLTRALCLAAHHKANRTPFYNTIARTLYDADLARFEEAKRVLKRSGEELNASLLVAKTRTDALARITAANPQLLLAPSVLPQGAHPAPAPPSPKKPPRRRTSTNRRTRILHTLITATGPAGATAPAAPAKASKNNNAGATDDAAPKKKQRSRFPFFSPAAASPPQPRNAAPEPSPRRGSSSDSSSAEDNGGNVRVGDSSGDDSDV